MILDGVLAASSPSVVTIMGTGAEDVGGVQARQDVDRPRPRVRVDPRPAREELEPRHLDEEPDREGEVAIIQRDDRRPGPPPDRRPPSSRSRRRGVPCSQASAGQAVLRRPGVGLGPDHHHREIDAMKIIASEIRHAMPTRPPASVHRVWNGETTLAMRAGDPVVGTPLRGSGDSVDDVRRISRAGRPRRSAPRASASSFACTSSGLPRRSAASTGRNPSGRTPSAGRRTRSNPRA